MPGTWYTCISVNCQKHRGQFPFQVIFEMTRSKVGPEFCELGRCDTVSQIFWCMHHDHMCLDKELSSGDSETPSSLDGLIAVTLSSWTCDDNMVQKGWLQNKEASLKFKIVNVMNSFLTEPFGPCSMALQWMPQPSAEASVSIENFSLCLCIRGIDEDNAGDHHCTSEMAGVDRVIRASKLWPFSASIWFFSFSSVCQNIGL
jgi:hypothetical protein